MSLLNSGLDRMSLRSKSPDDNSSLLSTSSLDSALNHSREEDELKALTCSDQQSDDQALRDDIEKIFAHSEYSWDKLASDLGLLGHTLNNVTIRIRSSSLIVFDMKIHTLHIKLKCIPTKFIRRRTTITSFSRNYCYSTPVSNHTFYHSYANTHRKWQ